MAEIEKPSQQGRTPQVASAEMAARQRLAVRVITLPAALSALAALLQVYDRINGYGSTWEVFISIGVTSWWIAVAIYLSDRRGRTYL
jgi:hypothetical protein